MLGMGKHVHRLSDKNFDEMTAVCAKDGPVNIKVYGNTYRCEVAYLDHQGAMKRERKGTQGYAWKSLKTDTCATCGFVAVDKVQMDLDHINGDRTDHRPENSQTLCSNCHRLKTHRPHLLALAT